MAPTTTEETPHIYLIFLKHLKTIDVDWKTFASETGIKTVGNAQRKLKTTLAKDNLQLVGGRIVPADCEVPAKNFKSPATKRKKDDDNADDAEEDDTPPSPTKKKRTKPTTKEASLEEEVC